MCAGSHGIDGFVSRCACSLQATRQKYEEGVDTAVEHLMPSKPDLKAPVLDDERLTEVWLDFVLSFCSLLSPCFPFLTFTAFIGRKCKGCTSEGVPGASRGCESAT